MAIKKMSVTQLTMLTAINMLGSGIILLPTKLAQVGNISIVSWVITAVGSMALAWAFACCGTMSNKLGGMGGYAEYAFGKAGNYIANYTYGVAIVIGNVAISITAVGYIIGLFNIDPNPLQIGLMTIGLLWLTTFANFGGASITGKIGGVTVWGVIAPVVVVSTVGWFWFKPEIYAAGWNPHNSTLLDAAGSSVAITLWAFLGLESACANSDAVDNPKKNVPIAVLFGTLGSAVIYIVSTNVIGGIIPNAELASSNAPFGLVFATMFTPMVGNIITGLMIIACIGSLLGWQFTTAQVFKSSAEVGYFVRIFAKCNKSGTPIAGMLILLGIQTILGWFSIPASPDGTRYGWIHHVASGNLGVSDQFSTVVDLSVVTNLIPYILSMAALVTIQEINRVPSRKALLNNAIAGIGAAYSYFALVNSGDKALMYGGVATILGFTLFGAVSARFVKGEQLVHPDRVITGEEDVPAIPYRDK
ncbi:putrescine-ornithine antiporter [Enterobacter sp. Cy-643]|uniref:putrescine-ornithine antiporter n=1 Tax=Enterobacter sp. Cy-643 TaxID=2608346 RepID=UPI00141F0F21|nr:putrescine-ornithine antiporter [Enterobacter sp. Cy-643]NIF32035.1 putrescine-ornithine antiporter [Enterobacter sp. Cy-643]